MTQVFRNPVVAAGLLVGALAIWIGPSFASRRSGSGAAPVVTEGTSTPAKAAVEPMPPAEGSRWRQSARLTRPIGGIVGIRPDPFSYELSVAETAPTSVAAVVMPPDLVLRGVSIHDGRALAVLNRRVVGEGDTVGDWRVARIESDVVWVDGPSGRFLLRFRAPPEQRPSGTLALDTATVRGRDDPLPPRATE